MTDEAREQQRKIEARIIIATGICTGIGVVVVTGAAMAFLANVIGEGYARFLCALAAIYLIGKVQDNTIDHLNQLRNRED